MTSKRIRSLLLVTLAVVLLAGCYVSDHYKEAAKVAEKAADRQAEQNAEMAQLNREVAEGTKRMVAADAEARKKIISVHQEIQAERDDLNNGFDKLEIERKEIAAQRRTESFVVPAVKLFGSTLIAIALLVFCTALIHGRRHDDAIEKELNELLITDLVNDHPQLLPLRRSVSALEDESAPAVAASPCLTSESEE